MLSSKPIPTTMANRVVNPSVKNKLEQQKAWRIWLSSLDFGGSDGNNQALTAKTLQDLLLTMGANAYKLELKNYLKMNEDLVIQLAANNAHAKSKLDVYYTVVQGSNLGQLFWSIEEHEDSIHFAKWREMVKRRQDKLNKGRKKAAKQSVKSSTVNEIDLWTYRPNYFFKAVSKNKRHILPLTVLIESLAMNVDKQSSKMHRGETIKQFLSYQKDELELQLSLAFADYLEQVQLATSLERSVERIRQINKQSIKLIKLYLLALKFGAEE